MGRGRLRVGVLGLSHDHVWDHLRQLVELGGAEIAAAADRRPELRERVRDYGCDLLPEDPALQLFADYSRHASPWAAQLYAKHIALHKRHPPCGPHPDARLAARDLGLLALRTAL